MAGFAVLTLAMAAIGAPAEAQLAGSSGNKIAAASVASSEGPSWESLSPAQKQVLAPLAADWGSIDGTGKAKWLEVAAKFPAMPPEERQRVQQRMSEWTRMTPTERGRARLNFQQTKQLSSQEKQARWDAYNALPEDERKALADRNRQKAEQRAKPVASSPAAPLDQSVPKQNQVAGSAASAPQVKRVTPTVVQAKPGATTTPMTKTPSPPAFQAPGQPKIAAKPNQVDSATLLPKRGAAPAAAAPAGATPSRP